MFIEVTTSNNARVSILATKIISFWKRSNNENINARIRLSDTVLVDVIETYDELKAMLAPPTTRILK